MGGGCKISDYGTLFPAAHLFSPSLADSVHHSAANAVSERNLTVHQSHRPYQQSSADNDSRDDQVDEAEAHDVLGVELRDG